MAELNERTRETIRASLDDGPFAAAWDRGYRLSVDDAKELALREAGQSAPSTTRS
jgi:hypothetical protein